MEINFKGHTFTFGLDQQLKASNGNIRLSFGTDFYPKGGDRVAQSQATASRICEAANAIFDLTEAGLKVGEDFSVQDTYKAKDGTYRPSISIWLNTSAGSTSAAKGEMSDEDLVTEAFSADAAAAEAIVGNSDTLSVIQRGRLRALIGASAPTTQATPSALPAETVMEEMPMD